MVVFWVDELEGTDTRHQFVVLPHWQPQCSLLLSGLGFRTWTSVIAASSYNAASPCKHRSSTVHIHGAPTHALSNSDRLQEVNPLLSTRSR